MDSPNTPCTMSSHQAMMKCPWQWRQPFLDEKLESRKRKVGDGYFYDPVDPSFVDHLLPGHAKKFCSDVLESEEKEQIQREIERLMMKKQEEDEELVESYDSPLFVNEQDSTILAAAASVVVSSVATHEVAASDVDVTSENQALVESILLMSRAVEEASQTSSLLASPESSFSSSDEEDTDGGASSCDEAPATERSSPVMLDTLEKGTFVGSPSLQLLSDNLHENFFTTDDDDLLDLTITTPRERSYTTA